MVLSFIRWSFCCLIWTWVYKVYFLWECEDLMKKWKESRCWSFCDSALLLQGLWVKRSFKSPVLIIARVGQLSADQNLSTLTLWSQQESTFHHASWLGSRDKTCRIYNDSVPKNGVAIIKSCVSFQNGDNFQKKKNQKKTQHTSNVL